jgi:2-aminoadipate transaminase
MQFSNRAEKIKTSALRELLRNADRPDIISFAGAFPSPKAFPVDIIKEITIDALDKNAANVLQYGSTEGYPPLREVIAEYSSSKGLNTQKENVIVVSGAQQGLELVAKTFLDPGDTVILGAPTYPGGIMAFKLFEPRFEAIPVKENGIKVDLLEDRLKRMKSTPPTKFMYVVPNFQNPSGATIPTRNRKMLYDLVCEYDLLILEDDPYAELRYEGKSLKPIKALDTEDRVIYLKTFSKTLAPGLRAGWMEAPEDLIEKFAIMKQGTDLFANLLGQHIAYGFMKGKFIEPQIRKIIPLYKDKRNRMLEALDGSFPAEVKWTKPEGGLFTWVTLPSHMDTTELLGECMEQKVAYVPGSAFYVDGGGLTTMRLSFGYVSDKQIEEGVRRLSTVIMKSSQTK